MQYLYLSTNEKFIFLGKAMCHRSATEGGHTLVFWSEDEEELQCDLASGNPHAWISPNSNLLVLNSPIEQVEEQGFAL